MFKKLSRDIEGNFEKTQIRLLYMKTTMSEVKTNKQTTLDEIKYRGDIAEEKITELEEIARETIQNKTQREEGMLQK